mgnify:CR=1 FL=1
MTILTEAPLVAKQRGAGGEFMPEAESVPALTHGLKPVDRGCGYPDCDHRENQHYKDLNCDSKIAELNIRRIK